MPLGGIAGEAFQVLPSAEKDILPGQELVMKRVPSVQRMRPGGRSVEGNRYIGENGSAQAHNQPQGAAGQQSSAAGKKL